MTAWDPDHYEQFFAERHQPGRDLIARIDAVAPARIVDLGCGTGRLTSELAARWPEATVVGVDRIDSDLHAEYLAACAARMALAYLANRRRETVFPFTRLFVLAGTTTRPAA